MVTQFLIVIGYSFKDKHINNILNKSCEINSNLKIIIINPENPANIFKNISENADPNTNLRVNKYYQLSLSDLFYNNNLLLEEITQML